MLLLAAACMHTPPRPRLPEPVVVRNELRTAEFDAEGRTCTWEAEGLWVGTRRVLGQDAPTEMDWCRAPSESWSTLDVLGQDGEFVSIAAASSSGPPGCGTWNVVTGLPATLVEYDEKLAERRVLRATRKLARRPLSGTFNADAFIVGNRHLRFCWFDNTGLRHDLNVP